MLEVRDQLMHIVDKNGLKGKENIEVEGLIPVGYNI